MLPPFRQYGNRFFLYFLILALSDPIQFFIYDILGIHFYPQNIYVVVFLILFFAVLKQNKMFRSYSFYICLISACTVLYLWGHAVRFLLEYIIIVFHAGIVFLLVKEQVKELSERGKLNWFAMLVILYEISMIIKFFQLAQRTRTGIVFFFLTTLFETLLGLFFIIFRYGDPRLELTIKSIEAEEAS